MHAKPKPKPNSLYFQFVYRESTVHETEICGYVAYQKQNSKIMIFLVQTNNNVSKARKRKGRLSNLPASFLQGLQEG